MMRIPLILLALASALCTQQINHIVTTGQSLSVGSNSSPALSTTQPYWNLYVTAGGFIPLVETTVESPGSAIANQITYLNGGGWVGLVTKHGEAGSTMSVIDKTNASCDTIPPYTPGTSCRYDNMMYYINFAKGRATTDGRAYTLSALSITHGESDEQSGLSLFAYKTALVNLQSDVKTDGNTAASLSASNPVPMFIDQVHTWTIYNHTTPTIALAQWQAARDNPGTIYIVGPKYQLAYCTDGLHLSNTGSRMLGWYIGKAMKKVLIDGQRWTALSPRSITRSGAVITARLWVPGGDLAIDTTIVADKGNGKGFEFSDDSGSTPAISSVSVSGDTATITLASTPTGGSQRLRYAYTGTSGALAGTSTAPHGNIRDTDSTLGQDGSTHLYDWLITFDEPIGFTWTPVCGIDTLALPVASYQAVYSQTLSTSGCTSPTFSVSSGSLPDGLYLNASTGVISGFPAATGTGSFTISVSDANGTPSQALSITVNAVTSMVLPLTRSLPPPFLHLRAPRH